MHLMRELKQLGARNLNQQRHPALTGKRRLQRVCNAYQQLMDGQSIHASYEVFYATAQLPS
jgi:malonyl-CoA O-methyltransferase